MKQATEIWLPLEVPEEEATFKRDQRRGSKRMTDELVRDEVPVPQEDLISNCHLVRSLGQHGWIDRQLSRCFNCKRLRNTRNCQQM